MNEDVLATAVGRYDTEPFLDIVPQAPVWARKRRVRHSDKSEALVGIDFRTWVHVTHLRARLRATDAHLAISPTFKIGDRKAFKERVRLNELLSFGSPRRVCARHG